MRTSRADLLSEAIRVLTDELGTSGVTVHPQTGAHADPVVDLVIDVGHGQLAVDVKAFSVVDRPRAQSLRSGRRRNYTVVVGDEVTEDARQLLTKAGMGWLDRRGRMRINAPGLVIDRDLEPDPRKVAGRAGSIPGRAGLELAVAVLLHPENPPSLRSIAAHAGLANSGLAAAAKSMRAAGLLREDNTPLPSLFLVTAGSWAPQWEDVAQPPKATHAVTSGTRAALLLGAPMLGSLDARARFYVSDAKTVRRLARPGRSRGPVSETVEVASAPVSWVMDTPVELPGEERPVAHPLFVALELAGDPGRGREILDDWNPPGVTRVW